MEKQETEKKTIRVKLDIKEEGSERIKVDLENEMEIIVIQVEEINS